LPANLILLELIDPHDTGMGLRVAGFYQTDLLELLGAEDRAQDRWMDTRWYVNKLPDVVDADCAALTADHDCQAAAALQKLMVSLFKNVQLSVFELLACKHHPLQASNKPIMPYTAKHATIQKKSVFMGFSFGMLTWGRLKN
jgi:hypothetical protein